MIQEIDDVDKRADYVLLHVLDGLGGESGFDELKAEIHRINTRLNEEGAGLPIQFSEVPGPRMLESRSFIRALNRCRDINAVQERGDRLWLTEFGEDIVER
jgi:hypothetical protein